MSVQKIKEVKKAWFSNTIAVFAVLAVLTVGMAVVLRFLFGSLNF